MISNKKSRRLRLALIFLVLLCACAPAEALRIDQLLCEYRENPLGIDIKAPRLSWSLQAEGRDRRQTAYEIVVSESRRDAERGRGGAWSSGKVNSSEQLHIEYAGAALRPFLRYFWRVRVWDENDRPSDWSPIAWFETAMLSSDDWQARWIGDGSIQFERDEDFYQDDPMPLFRKTFQVPGNLTEARLYISGLGYYEASLNGEKVGDHDLDPGWTAYGKEVLYSVYDITALVRQGENAIAVALGNGWYNPLPIRLFGRFNLRDYQETGRPCLKAEIHLRYRDGAVRRVVSDDSWLTAPGPTVRNNVYLGEHHDARREWAGWTSAKFDDSAWKKAAFAPGPSGTLNAQMQPPIKLTRILKPQGIHTPQSGVFIFDFGQNFAGVARLKVSGPAGTKITLRYGEDLHPDGTLNFLTTVAGQIKEMWNLSGGPGAPPTAWQEDSYILKGQGREIWFPRFTFHGFRYVEVSGWPGQPTLDDLEGLRFNADLPLAGSFECSNPLFNRLDTVLHWTFLSNVFSVQSDCPGREKMGYGGDIVTTAETFMYYYDMANFYRKAVRDFRNDQQPDGGITEIAPYTGIADRGYGGHSGPLGWQLAFPFMQQKLYEFHGDKRIIEENYEAFQRQMAFLQQNAGPGGLFYWDISDHASLEPKPEAFTAAAFYYHHARLIAEFAGILGREDDARQYGQLAERIKTTMTRKYHIPATGRFDNATQAAQIFALWYDLAPDKEAAFQVLEKEFDRHDWHVSTGIFATKMFFDIMRANDRNEWAYRVANQRSYPGWGHMLERGATTLWESWRYPDNGPSQNHPMFGSIGEWFYRSLLGINPGAPGFETVVVKPQPAGDLTWARGAYRSIRGLITSEWRREGDEFQLRVNIPPNTKAEIWLLAGQQATTLESGKLLSATPGIAEYKRDGRYLVISCGSGNYTFSSKLN